MKKFIKKKIKAKFLKNSNFYLNCWYTNATSLNNKMSIFKAEVAMDQPDVIFISETWFNDNSCPSLNGYNIFRRDRGDQRCGGGVPTI